MRGQDMQRLRELEEFINNVKIKPVKRGGLDKEDVELQFNSLIAMVKDIALSFQKKEVELKDRYETRIQALELTIRSLDQKLSKTETEKSLAIEKAIEDTKERCIVQYAKQLKECMDSLDVIQNAYEEMLSLSKAPGVLEEEMVSEPLELRARIHGIANKYKGYKDQETKEKEKETP